MLTIQNVLQNGACDTWQNRTRLSSKAQPFTSSKVAFEDKLQHPLSESSETALSTDSSDHGKEVERGNRTPLSSKAKPWTRLSSKAQPFTSIKVVSDDKSPRSQSDKSEPEPSTASSDHDYKQDLIQSSSDSEPEYEDAAQDFSGDCLDLEVSAGDVGAEVVGLTGQTTIMMRRIPNKYTQQSLMNEINSVGFAGTYDFIYLPNTAHSPGNRGFGFINFVSAGFADMFYSKYNGKRFQLYDEPEPLVIRPAEVQGFEASAQAFFAKKKLKNKRLSEPVFLKSLMPELVQGSPSKGRKHTKGTAQKKKKKQDSCTPAQNVEYMNLQMTAPCMPTFVGDALGLPLPPGLPAPILPAGLPPLPMPPPPGICVSCGGGSIVGNAFCRSCTDLLSGE